MRAAVRVGIMTCAGLLALPAHAFAADDRASVVPEWLSIIAGIVGLGIAVILMVNAVLLKRVAEGSYVADNIAYMMSGVVCFGASMLARWVGLFAPEAALADQMSWAADLLVTAGMALLAVYFTRVRFAMSRYLKSVTELYAGALADQDADANDTVPAPDGPSDESGSEGEVGG